MPCIRCGKITAKLCTCSIEEAKEAFSAWSEIELQQTINTLKRVLGSKQTEARGILGHEARRLPQAQLPDLRITPLPSIPHGNIPILTRRIADDVSQRISNESRS